MTPWLKHTETANAKAVACGLATATAGGTGDNTAVTGATIDRTGFGCVQLAIAWLTTLGSAKTLKIAAEYQTSSDGSSWATAVPLESSTTVDTGTKSGDVGQQSFNLDLGGVPQYIRFNFTPDLSATDTDTAVVAALATLLGPDKTPHP